MVECIFCINQARHAVTQLPPEGADPWKPVLLVAEAACLWAAPVLCWVDVEVDASWAASTTSILPPNSKLLFLIWVLLLLKVADWHEHTSAAATLFCWVSGRVLMNEPVVAEPSDENALRVACPRTGRPVWTEPSSWH